MKRNLIKIPIYNANIEIFKGKIDELNEEMKKMGLDEMEPSCDSRTVWHEERNRFRIYWREDADFKLGILAHECKHLVDFIFRARGIDLDIVNDEPECYLLGFIVDKVNNVLTK